MSLLREILLETDLTETAKWMHPCYMYEDSNLIIIQDFKNYCALMFIKGVLMEDPINSCILLVSLHLPDSCDLLM